MQFEPLPNNFEDHRIIEPPNKLQKTSMNELPYPINERY